MKRQAKNKSVTTNRKVKKNRQSKRVVWMLGILVTGLVITVTTFVAQQRYNTQQYASSNDLYVAPTGNDGNNGSQSAPYLTIQKAADVATPGTTVHVLPGTYTKGITINVSGTATAPITFISDTKWGAKLVTTGTSGVKSYIIRNNGSYIRIINFDMSSNGVSDGIDNFGSNNFVQGNHIHDMANIKCTGSPGGAALGDDAGSNNTYDSNVVNNIGGYPTKCDYVHAIYVDDSGDVVTNNITYNNAGNGLYTNHGSGSITFANNLSFANAEYGLGINGSSGADNIVASNNILVSNGIAGIKTWSTVTGTHNQLTNNLLYNNASLYIQGGTVPLKNTITADPQFVNYQSNGTGDYHLKSTSPAIDAGVALGAPAMDYEDNSRPQGNGYDIGAFEFGVAATPTTAVSDTPVPSTAPTSTPVLPSATQTPTLTPTPATFILGQDNFHRANQTYWGTASDGNVWKGDAASNKIFSISSNVGQIKKGTSTYNAILGSSVVNAQVLFTGSLSNYSNTNIGAVVRFTDANNWYKAYLDGKNLVIQKKVNASTTTLKNVSYSARGGTNYSLRFQVVGTTLSAKVWVTGKTEPTSWTATVSDSSLASGYCGLRVQLTSSITASYTSFVATAL
jgi:hypothetical protein